MAFLYSDSFSDYSTPTDMQAAGWSFDNVSFFTISSTGGFYGAPALQKIEGGATDTAYVRIKAPGGNAIRFSFWFTVDAGTNMDVASSATNCILMLRNVTLTRSFQMKISPVSGRIVWKNWTANSSWVPSTADYTATSGNLLDGEQHHIEGYVVLGASSNGTVQIWVDGSLVIDQTSVTNDGGLGDSCTAIEIIDILGQIDTTSGITATAELSHLAVWDATGDAPTGYVGPHRLVVARPDGAGDSTGFTPNTGNNWAAVDDTVRNGDTDYVEASSAATKDLYTYSTFGTTVDTIVGVNVRTWAKNPDVGTKQFKMKCKSSATEDNGATFTLTGSYALYQETFGVDPNTSAAWTISGLNAAQFGFEVV